MRGAFNDNRWRRGIEKIPGSPVVGAIKRQCVAADEDGERTNRTRRRQDHHARKREPDQQARRERALRPDAIECPGRPDLPDLMDQAVKERATKAGDRMEAKQADDKDCNACQHGNGPEFRSKKE